MIIGFSILKQTKVYSTLQDVSDTNEMEIIRQKTGICPQHNILFDDLTCVEHLQLFAGIKGVPDDKVEKEVDSLILALQGVL